VTARTLGQGYARPHATLHPPRGVIETNCSSCREVNLACALNEWMYRLENVEPMYRQRNSCMWRSWVLRRPAVTKPIARAAAAAVKVLLVICV
jgi:hypothetical protein